jgi:hypothetical protein
VHFGGAILFSCRVIREIQKKEDILDVLKEIEQIEKTQIQPTYNHPSLITA